ncbi:hypothetical protein KI387_031980, partial [Taxus chinensis]
KIYRYYNPEEVTQMLNYFSDDIPAGHLPVYVGLKQQKRFVVRVRDVNHPLFGELLDKAEEEYGFNPSGRLTIPCDEFHFRNVLSVPKIYTFAEKEIQTPLGGIMKGRGLILKLSRVIENIIISRVKSYKPMVDHVVKLPK